MTSCLPLAAWRLHVSLDGPIGSVRFEHVRAFVSELVERGTGAPAHRSHLKQHTTAPLVVEPGGRDATIECTTLSVEARDRLVGNVASRRPSLGPVAVRIRQLQLLAETSFEQLRADAPADRAVRLEFLSPTTFLHGRSSSSFPTPGLVFGSHRARWNGLAPDDLELDLDLSALDLAVVGFEGRSGTVTLGVRGPKGRHQRDFVGFVGTVEYGASRGTAEALRAWAALSRFAPFCGTGANTTVGMGVTAHLPPSDRPPLRPARPKRPTRSTT